MEITETHLNAIQEVAAALRMTLNEFLSEEVTDITPEQVTLPHWMVDKIAQKYNGGDEYPEMVKEVFNIVDGYEFIDVTKQC